MSKGQHTHDAILTEALDLASQLGLEAMSIGSLAKRVGMSKSGLYAHFSTKEALQGEILDLAARRFTDEVFLPALREPRGLPRLRRVFERWLRWESDLYTGGCPFVAASIEFDDRPGPVKDRLVFHLQSLLGSVARTARISVDEGHLRPDTDCDQIAFDTWAILLAYHQFKRLLGEPDARARAQQAFARLVEMYSA